MKKKKRHPRRICPAGDGASIFAFESKSSELSVIFAENWLGSLSLKMLQNSYVFVRIFSKTGIFSNILAFCKEVLQNVYHGHEKNP